ncbi:ABC transporter substrate-binding protein [Neobacillus sp. YX16]|uniref:ABC transporter substrate-binding protein n=1 Tax=Neobacillus sp. YX16 TaxID=3047874 RepID=UPI0024C425D7|nr:ABC transporter substrate-binding protein [Neobacillus sp. YX16]WHZ05243.1 ABC transporter substrate-binding protein [Neobacillus sp. YX16]
MKNFKNVFSLLMVICLIVLSACNSDEANSGDNGKGSDTYEIGALFPLTGDLALLGEESFRGVELAVEEINNAGGVEGKKIKLVKADAGDPDAAQSEANRLINQEDVKTIVGSFSSGISFAATEVAERNGALYWELGAVADNVTDREYKNVLRINPPASFFSVVNINFIKDVVAKELGKNVGDLRVAIVHEDSSYGTTIAEEAKKLAGKEKINIVTTQGYSSGTNDLSSVVLNLKDAKPDVLIAVGYLNDAVLLARQSEELGFDVPVLLGNGGGHTMTDFRDAVGDLANGIFNIDFPQYQINREFTPGMDEFIEAYKEKYGHEPRSGHSLANYMGMKVVADIIGEVGEIDPEKLRDAALKYKVDPRTTATGWGVDFDSTTGQNMLGEPYLHQWVDGELITVWPEDVAVEAPSFE